MTLFSIQSFLKECELSSQKAYDAFKGILFQSSEIEEIKKTYRCLNLLFEFYEKEDDKSLFLEKYHFNFKTILLGGHRDRLKLIQFPSIFSPEEWSFTFYEGLSRLPNSTFTGKKISELGCGNGWICLSLALNTDLDFIYGLDINPRAIICAKLNLAFNSFESDEKAVKTYSEKNLWESVLFEESDLLSFIRNKEIFLDKVIGCIPQVLSPDPEKLIQNISEYSSDEQLYDLSNYCSIKGHLEDEFGLGLIASALEESLQVLKAGGSVIMNLGGRPGTTILEELFKRRGFTVNKLWSTKVLQAEDTDIKVLVEIEKRTGHKFEFFMGLDAREPINAQTAEIFSKNGGRIAHSLSVYEAHLPKRKEVQNILNFLENDSFSEAKQLMDLYSGEKDIFEERVNFLSELSEVLRSPSLLPYEKTQGRLELRIKLSRFLTSYYHLPVNQNQILISPSRHECINNILLLYRPKLVLIDEVLFDQDPQLKRMNEFYPWEVESFACPRRVKLIENLVEKLKPDLLVCFFNTFENELEENVERIFRVTKENSTRLILDMSDYFDISSQPQKNAILSYLREKPLPNHVIINCDLLKNRVYENLRLCFSLIGNAPLVQQLSSAAELSYSRTPFLTQFYYEVLLDELLSFRLLEDGQKKEIFLKSDALEGIEKGFKSLAVDAVEMMEHPSMARERLPRDEKTIRLDYGENSFPIPKDLRSDLFEGFLRNPLSLNKQDYGPEDDLKRMFEKSFGFSKGSLHKKSFVYGNGIAPLFHSLSKICAIEKYPIIFPQGAYGEFVACAGFVGAKAVTFQTEEKDSFKFTPSTLNKALENKKGAYVFLNFPVVNPTGALYKEEEIIELIEVIKSHQARLILDHVFNGLEFDSTNRMTKIGKVLNGDFEWVMLGGVSKLFAAGGLRFGYALCSHFEIAQNLSEMNSFEPHFATLYAVKKIIKKFNGSHPSLVTFLAEQRSLLRKRALLLTKKLQEANWEVLPAEGGLFLVAAPRSYFGKEISVNSSHFSEEKNYILNSQNFYEAFFFSTGILINGSEWTGIPDYCRFVLSVSEQEFQEGVKAVESFSKKVDGEGEA